MTTSVQQRSVVRFGRLDSVVDGVISGVVFESAERGGALPGLLVEDALLGVVERFACHDQPVKVSGRSGFRFAHRLDKRLFDGSRHQLRIVIEDGHQLIDGGEFELYLPAKRDHWGISTLRVEGGSVTGWVFEDGRDALTVRLLIDGEVVEEGRSGVVLPWIESDPAYLGSRVDVGFILGIPLSAMDGYDHRLSVEIGEWPGYKRRLMPTIDYRSGAIFGHVESRKHGVIEGWVGYREVPDQPDPILLESVDGGQPLARVRGQPMKREWAVAKGCLYAESFSVALPKGLVRVSCSRVELRGSPVGSDAKPQILGLLESVTRDSIDGWVVDKGDLTRTVELALVIDGVVIGAFRPNYQRPDVLDKLQLSEEESGLNGFRIGTPELLLDGREHQLTIVATVDGTQLNSQLKESGKRICFPTGYLRLKDLPGQGAPVRPLAGRASRAGRQRATRRKPLVSLIVLNRNGAELLDELFQSWTECNSLLPCEWIVVDHASSDSSRQVIDAWKGRLSLKSVELDYNDSFSASCNRAAAMARGDLLLFVNNDIVWIQDILPAMVESLRDPSIGVVGIKLLKYTGDRGSMVGSQIQHLGVRYQLIADRYWPMELRPGYGVGNELYQPLDVACVTGAVMACRRVDFQSVGGFSERYFYGFEDVEFCHRFREETGKRVVCRNDLVALHHHGYTRLTGRDMQVFKRLSGNEALLMRDVGALVKRRFMQSLWSGDGIHTGERLTIAFVVASRDGAVVGSDLTLATAVARQWQAEQPGVEPVFLLPGQRWHEGQKIHLMVVMDPCYQLPTILNARADMVLVAWIRDRIGLWFSQPWFGSFDHYMVATGSQAAEFAAATGWHVELLSDLLLDQHMEPLSSGSDLVGKVEPVDGVASFVYIGSLDSTPASLRHFLADPPADLRPVIHGDGWDESLDHLVHWRGRHDQYTLLAGSLSDVRLVIVDGQLYREQIAIRQALLPVRWRGIPVLLSGEAESGDPDCVGTIAGDEPVDAAVMRWLQPGEGDRAELERLRQQIEAENRVEDLSRRLFQVLEMRSLTTLRVAIRLQGSGDSEAKGCEQYRLALGLQSMLKRSSDCICWVEWQHDPESWRVADVLVTTGGESDLRPDLLTIYWLTDGLERISESRLQQFDHLWVASERVSRSLQERGLSASTLLPCIESGWYGSGDAGGVDRLRIDLFSRQDEVPLAGIVADSSRLVVVAGRCQRLEQGVSSAINAVDEVRRLLERVDHCTIVQSDHDYDNRFVPIWYLEALSCCSRVDLCSRSLIGSDESGELEPPVAQPLPEAAAIADRLSEELRRLYERKTGHTVHSS